MTAPDDAVTRTRFEPPQSDAGAPFWDASREQRFILPWCLECERSHWYPREACPHCGSLDIVWRDATGQGTVHACSVMPKAAMPMLADRVPYAVVIVELAEGPRMMSNIVSTDPGFDPFAVIVGLRVALVWEPLSDGRYLPVFVAASPQ